jgi:hypothetical protein
MVADERRGRASAVKGRITLSGAPPFPLRGCPDSHDRLESDSRAASRAAVARLSSAIQGHERLGRRLLFEHLRTLDPRESLRLCMEACRTMDELLIAGLRRDHPSADDEEIEFRLAVTKYGAEIVEACTGRRLPGK